MLQMFEDMFWPADFLSSNGSQGNREAVDLTDIIRASLCSKRHPSERLKAALRPEDDIRESDSDPAGDVALQHFMRAPAVEQEACVTEITLSCVFHGIAITGENTSAFVGSATRRFSGEVFCHGCFFQRILPASIMAVAL